MRQRSEVKQRCEHSYSSSSRVDVAASVPLMSSSASATGARTRHSRSSRLASSIKSCWRRNRNNQTQRSLPSTFLYLNFDNDVRRCGAIQLLAEAKIHRRRWGAARARAATRSSRGRRRPARRDADRSQGESCHIRTHSYFLLNSI